MRSLLTSSVLLFANLVPGQFVLDAANGAGAHFTDLVTALNTVPDGATLLVRPGSYVVGVPTAVAKGLSIVGLGAVSFAHYSQLRFGPTTAAQSLRIVNVKFESGSPESVVFADLSGPLLLDRVEGTGAPASQRFDFLRCAQVHCQALRMTPPGATGFTGTASERARFVGTTATLLDCDVSGHFLEGTAVTALDSTLYLDNSRLAGGTGLSCLRGTTTAGAPGLTMQRSQALLRAGTVSGGDGGTFCGSSQQAADAYAIVADGVSRLRLESTQLLSRRGGIQGGIVQTRNTVSPPRTSIAANSIDLTANPGAVAVLVLGLDPTIAPVAGAIGVSEVVPLAVLGPVTVIGQTWSLPISPPSSALRATVLAQHAVLDRGELWLTGAAQIVLP